MKRILPWFLCLLIGLSGLAGAEVTKSSGSFVCGDFVCYLFEDGTAQINDYIAHSYTSELTIPAEMDGHPVVSIGDYAFSDCHALTNVTLPEGLLSIDEFAFASCINLASVTLPNGLTTLGVGAFSDCDHLTDIFLPDSVADLRGNPFPSCNELVRIFVTTDHPALEVIDGALYALADRRLICWPAGLAIGECTVAPGTRVIGVGAFDGCADMTGVTLLDGLTTIGDYAFSYCSGLTDVTLPDGLADIGDFAFSRCSSLTGLSLPDGLTAVSDYAFFDCSSLTDVAFPDGLTTIGNYAFFDCSGLTDVTLPNGLTDIGDSAFARCSDLTRVALPDSVLRIGKNPFAGCLLLTEIAVSPDHPALVVIDGALYARADRRLVCWPAGLAIGECAVAPGTRVIGDSAFYGCAGMTGVTLPDGLISIENFAFGNCRMASIALPASLSEIESNAFSSNSNWGIISEPPYSLVVPADSVAERFCKENGLAYTLSDD